MMALVALISWMLPSIFYPRAQVAPAICPNCAGLGEELSSCAQVQVQVGLAASPFLISVAQKPLVRSYPVIGTSLFRTVYHSKG